MDRNQLAQIGAETLIDRAVDSVKKALRQYPDLRRSARDKFAFLAHRNVSHDEEADEKAKPAKKRKPLTKEQRAAIGRRVSAAWKARNARKAEAERNTRSKRGRPPKAARTVEASTTE